MDEKLSAFFSLEIFDDNLPSTDQKNVKIPLFDVSLHDDSNEPLIIFLWSLDGEKTQFNVFEKVPFVYSWQVGVYLLNFVTRDFCVLVT